jgi:hypothetical protein
VVEEGDAQDFLVGQTAGLQKLAHLMHGNALVCIAQPEASHFDRVWLRMVAATSNSVEGWRSMVNSRASVV